MQQCRREYSRVEVSWPASIFTSAGFIDGRVKNVSIGGALINCRSLPNLEETFSLTIEIPDYLFPLSAVVKKVRLNVYDSEGDETPASYDLAVQFIDMSSEDRKVFINAIEKAVRTQHIRPVKEEEVRPPPTESTIAFWFRWKSCQHHLGAPLRIFWGKPSRILSPSTIKEPPKKTAKQGFELYVIS